MSAPASLAGYTTATLLGASAGQEVRLLRAGIALAGIIADDKAGLN
jgi:hypothetical protein